MLSPLDIKTTKFSSSPIGYKKSEVDTFFDDVLKDYEKLYMAHADLNEKIKSLNKQIETYKSIEETMKNTLIVAQSSAEQLTSAARNEAESIVNEANIKSKEIIEKAGLHLEDLTNKFTALKSEIRQFVEHSKSEFSLKTQRLEKIMEEIDKTSI